MSVGRTVGYIRRRGSSDVLFPQQDMYPRPDNRVEYQIFGSEYFSNADVKVYFGDIWVDDATAIAFQLQEELLPIYGYNSYTFDTVARGRRLIQGHFSINFKSVGYLHKVLANANAIFYTLEKGEQSGIIQPHYYQNMRLDEIMRKLGKDSFDQIADEYEKAIWGETDNEEFLNFANSPYFKQDPLGFDLRIQYGAISESTGYVQDRYYQSEKKVKPSTTVDIVNGVQLSGMSKQISTSDQGAPIQEMYSFIARDLNGISFAHLQRQNNRDSDFAETYRRIQYEDFEE